MNPSLFVADEAVSALDVSVQAQVINLLEDLQEKFRKVTLRKGIMKNQKVALFGLGVMGRGMAGQLLAHGYELSVFNRSLEKAKAFEEKGASVGATPKEAAEGADILISMVADDRASRSIWTGEAGALADIKQGAIIIETSTLSVDWVKELAKTAADHGVSFLDAPVTGSRLQAESGNLKFFVGGEADAFERAASVFGAMGEFKVHLGPSGSGALFKLVNNYLCGVQVASLAEALAVLERSGLDSSKSLELLRAGAPASPIFKLVSERMETRDYQIHFDLTLMAKDLEYAQAEGKEYGVSMRLAEAARSVFREGIRKGIKEMDMSAVVEQFRQDGAKV